MEPEVKFSRTERSPPRPPLFLSKPFHLIEDIEARHINSNMLKQYTYIETYCQYLSVRWSGCRGILPRSQPIAASIRTRDTCIPAERKSLPRYQDITTHTPFIATLAKPPKRYLCQRTESQHTVTAGGVVGASAPEKTRASLRRTPSCAADAKNPTTQQNLTADSNSPRRCRQR